MSDSVYKNDNRRNRMGFSMDARRAFHLVCYFGIAGVLVDIDHVIAWAVRYLSNGETIYSTRFLHTSILFGSGIVLLGCGAYLGRLYLQYILKGDKG